MSIKFTKSYTVGNKCYATLEEAQLASLVLIFEAEDIKQGQEDLAIIILKHKDEIMDILTTTESSRPAARKVNGGTKKRKPKTTATDAPTLPLHAA